MDLSFEEFSTANLKILRIADHPEIVKQCYALEPTQVDKEELSASNGRGWAHSVIRSVGTKNAHACLYMGKVRALFGANPDALPGVLFPWMFSDGVIQKERPMEFQRVCLRILRKLQGVGIPLVNYAQEDCARYDWLETLGFRFSPERVWCAGSVAPFRKFQWNPEVDDNV